MPDEMPGKPPMSLLNHPLVKPARRGAELLQFVGRVLIDAVGFDRKSAPALDAAADVGTRLAGERTGMALERTYWALDRTLMAWIRTSLSMISFGFTIGKLGQAMQDVEIKALRGNHVLSVGTIALFLVILGTITLLVASWQYAVRMHGLCEKGLRPQRNLSFFVGVLLSAMGMFAFTALVSGL